MNTTLEQVKPRFNPKKILRRGLGITLGVLALAARWTVLKPLDLPPRTLAPDSRVQFWQLSSGSRIAYRHIAAVGQARPFPVVFLHGGPGGYFSKSNVQVLGQLAQDGFQVYFYDQLGGGRSSRLKNPSGYTVARQVSDLELIRQQIGSEKLILIGHSFGSSLAGHYLKAHPQRVERMILGSASPLWPAGIKSRGNFLDAYSPAARAKVEKLQELPKLIVANFLAGILPSAAYTLLPDSEMDAFYGAILNADNQPNDQPIEGFGGYANRILSQDLNRLTPDPRAALQTALLPVLVLRPEQDYLTLEVARDWLKTLPNSRLETIPNSSHRYYDDQPQIALERTRAFLLE
jgi:pimeloyl-ACP methyl ester carboxylesterase